MYAIYIRACVCVYVRGELARSFQELYFIQARVCTLRIPQNSQNCSRISICYIGTEIPQWTPSLKCGAWIIFTIRTLLSSFLLMYKKKNARDFRNNVATKKFLITEYVLYCSFLILRNRLRSFVWEPTNVACFCFLSFLLFSIFILLFLSLFVLSHCTVYKQLSPHTIFQYPSGGGRLFCI